MGTLFNDFFSISHLQSDNCCIRARISLHETHSIYKAHFPENPITPGVCILQISKEILEMSINKLLILTEAKSIKFLNLLMPKREVIFNIDYQLLEENEIKAVIVVSDDKYQFAKMQLTYKAY